jgi:hypothetical protein
MHKNLDDLIAYAYTQEFNNPLAYELARNLEAYRQVAEQLLETHQAANQPKLEQIREAGL